MLRVYTVYCLKFNIRDLKRKYIVSTRRIKERHIFSLGKHHISKFIAEIFHYRSFLPQTCSMDDPCSRIDWYDGRIATTVPIKKGQRWNTQSNLKSLRRCRRKYSKPSVIIKVEIGGSQLGRWYLKAPAKR